MKHLSRITANTPASAALWQEVICRVIGMFGDVTESKGGTSQLDDYAGTKCYFGEGEPEA